MTSDITALVDFYEREKELPREKIINALEHAFLSAYRKMVPGGDRIERLTCEIDAPKGRVLIYAEMLVVADDDVRDKCNEVPFTLAQRLKPGIEIGATVRANVTPKDFGRIAVQTARQAMMQRLRDAEKELLYEEFKDRAGDIISGTVRRFEKGDIYVELDKKYEGVMINRERIPTEEYNTGDRLRFYIVEVRDGVRGPEVILSRSHPNLVRRLFESEVSEIADKTVEIRGIAREAGYRTKITVISNDPKVDPVGACVGMRGARVKNIVRELNNEKVDIIEWTEDPAEFVRSALAPVDPREITIDEEAHTVNIIVNDEKELAKAIGRRGQNARLTARLMGWDIQVRAYDPEAEMKRQQEHAAQGLSSELGISLELALGLLDMGCTDSTVLADIEPEEIMEHLHISLEEAQALVDKAKA